MKFYQSNLLNNFTNLTHALTTKESGNVAFHVGDDIKTVLANHEKLAIKLNYDKSSLIFMKQIHSDIVHVVDENDNFNNPPTCDALITNKIDTPLMVMVGDCSPILFYDDKQKVIAVAHAGRQGTLKNIVKNVIDSFSNNYSSNVEDIIVHIGASIGICCYEINKQIYDEVKKLKLQYAIIKNNDTYYLDIKKILRTQLLTSDIKEGNIEISELCTCCNSEILFSYRSDKNCGRFCAIITL